MISTKVLNILEKYTDPDSKLLIALSGGIDSVVLLNIIAEWRSQNKCDNICKCVYVHHGLSENADLWGTQCVLWAKQLGVECYIEKVSLDVKGKSIEKEARDKRYDALLKHVDNKTLLLTAQHKDDQLETFLLAVKRGSGPAGLASMPEAKPFGQGTHLRPMLGVERSEIEDYAALHKLEWLEDESNQDTRFDRNFIRHIIKPRLTERWPSIRDAIARVTQLCGKQEELIEELLTDQLKSRTNTLGGLGVYELSQNAGVALIRLWLRNKGIQMPTSKQSDQIWHSLVMAKADANPVVNIGHCEIRRYKGYIYAVNPSSHDENKIFKFSDNYCSTDTHRVTLSLGKGPVKCPSKNEIVTVRYKYIGDDIKPFGRCGHRKLKKIFQEMNVPPWQRTRLPMIFYNEKLVTIPGLLIIDEYHSDKDNGVTYNVVEH